MNLQDKQEYLLSYEAVPFLSSNEQVLANALDPKRKLIDLIYQPEKHESPYQPNFARNEQNSEEKKGGLPILPALGMAAATAMPYVKKYVPKVLKAIPSIFSGITNLFKRKQDGRGITPANIRGGGFSGGFERRLAKWLMKNGPIMDYEEEKIRRGGSLYDMQKSMGKWLKKGFEHVNKMSSPAAKLVRERVLKKLMPWAHQTFKSANRLIDKTGDAKTMGRGYVKGMSKYMLNKSGVPRADVRQMFKRPDVQELLQKYPGSIAGSGIIDSLGEIFNQGTSLIGDIANKAPDVINKFQDSIKGIDMDRFGINSKNIANAIRATTGISSKLMGDKSVRKAFEKKNKKLTKMLKKIQKEGLIDDIQHLFNKHALDSADDDDSDDEYIAPSKQKQKSKKRQPQYEDANFTRDEQNSDDEEDYESPPPTPQPRRKRPPAKRTEVIGEGKKKTPLKTRAGKTTGFKVSIT